MLLLRNKITKSIMEYEACTLRILEKPLVGWSKKSNYEEEMNRKHSEKKVLRRRISHIFQPTYNC